MRTCPICNFPKRKQITKNYMHTPIELSGVSVQLSRFECGQCGHHYLDAPDASQAWFDEYYLTQYKTDDKPHSAARLDSLAACVAQFANVKALDIGGMDHELQTRIQARGRACDVAGVGDSVRRAYNAVILSHTLEHIYDVAAMFERIKAAMYPGGLLFVEGPIHLDYDDLAYDNHWQHINKFRVQDIVRLIEQDFEIDYARSGQLPDYREYKTWRIVARLA